MHPAHRGSRVFARRRRAAKRRAMEGNVVDGRGRGVNMKDDELLTDEDVAREVQDGISAAGGVRALARLVGISPSVLCRVANGKRPPSRKLLQAMNLKRVARYKRIPTRQ